MSAVLCERPAMRRLTLTTFVSLDGVMQAPGGADEDRDDGFTKGGWLVPFADEEFGPLMMEWYESAGGFVFGRKTYERFAGHWPHVPDANPIAKKLNSLPKFVAEQGSIVPSIETNSIQTSVERLSIGNGNSGGNVMQPKDERQKI